jgi:hypothetical protein
MVPQRAQALLVSDESAGSIKSAAKTNDGDPLPPLGSQTPNLGRVPDRTVIFTA